ncbi:MAG: DegT/DnrJ/EryC1/StrS family aminotransferase [Candidatus Rokubacteria bacterium]|nr:DegT/DnrJ/EryC1/StrS family aminotransferase [Candidatus Rokubacteria bacterium]
MRERMLVGAPQLGEAAVEAAAAVIRSGWLGAGPKVVEFEERFAAHVGARHAVAVSSGTAALFLSLVALGVGRGNEVITTPLTAAATANAIEQTGAVPVFADVDPRTLTLDPGAVAGAVTARTKAIVAVHVGGQPCAMAELHAIARRHDLVVVEDAADALGASYRGRPIGGLGGTAAFSFGDEAAIVTGGGGMVTTDDATLAAELRLLRAHGTATSTWQRLHGDAGTSAEVQGPGYRAELSDVAAALALAQLPAQPAGLRARAEIAARYDEALAPLRVARPAPAAGGDVHAHGRYLALLEPGGWRIDRTRVVDALRKEHIGAGVYRALHTHSFYRSRVRAETAACVHAEDVGGRLFTLPLAAGMTEADVDDVIAALEKLAAVYAS